MQLHPGTHPRFKRHGAGVRAGIGASAVSGSFTVYFDGSLWVGVVLEEHDGRCKAGRYVFGPEPSSNEIFEWVRKGCPGLILNEVSGTEREKSTVRAKNPKRAQREARRTMSQVPVSTYAQEKIKEARSAVKQTSRAEAKSRRDERAEELFRIRQEKRKKKHRGH